jgi:hypothetical protein
MGCYVRRLRDGGSVAGLHGRGVPGRRGRARPTRARTPSRSPRTVRLTRCERPPGRSRDGPYIRSTARRCSAMDAAEVWCCVRVACSVAGLAGCRRRLRRLRQLLCPRRRRRRVEHGVDRLSRWRPHDVRARGRRAVPDSRSARCASSWESQPHTRASPTERRGSCWRGQPANVTRSARSLSLTTSKPRP